MLWMLASVAWAESLAAVHGWTTDGGFVYEVTRQVAGDGPDPVYTATRYVRVLDPAGTVTQAFAVAIDEAPGPDVAAWEAYRTAHPLVGSAARAASTGERLEVRAAVGAWEGDTHVVQATLEDDEGSLSVGLSRAGEGLWIVHTMPIEATAFGGYTYRTSAWFHPDLPRAALVIDQPDVQTMRGPISGSATVRLVPTRPLVSVLAPTRLAGQATAAAAAIAGLGTIATGEAMKDRASTVVYHAEGFAQDAAAIAAKIPGGATVEPLTWEAPQHIVVALGAP